MNLFVSPHLDDAALSAGRAIAASSSPTIVTVMAGTPRETNMRTAHDQACGFTDATSAMVGRRAEDRAACQVLGARYVHGELLDRQYLGSPSLLDVTTWLRHQVTSLNPDRLFIPLGLSHPDHALVAEAALNVWQNAGSPVNLLVLWADAPYWQHDPVELSRRLAAVQTRGVKLERTAEAQAPIWTKAAAVACYRSQISQVDVDSAVHTPEHYWSARP